MPEYVVTILSAYIVTAKNEHAAGEAAYDVVTGASIITRIGSSVAPRKRGDDVEFGDGRILRAFNAELVGPVEEVVEPDEAEQMQKTAELLTGMLGEGVPDHEVWIVHQKNDVWWVRDHEKNPIVSASVRTEAIELAEAIGKDQNRVFKIVQEKS